MPSGWLAASSSTWRSVFTTCEGAVGSTMLIVYHLLASVPAGGVRESRADAVCCITAH